MNKTITMYELLGKIYNRNEDMPKRIKVFGEEFEYKDEDYYSIHSSTPLISYFGEDYLCDELKYNVEIIEEKKIPEKLIKLNNVSNASDLIALSHMQWENNNLIEVKLNQVIDYLNSKGE